MKDAEKRLAEIAVLKTHIINYAKTRGVYVAYRKSCYSKKFFEAHREAMEEMKTYTMAKHNIDGFLEKSNREEKDHYKKRRNIDR